MATYKVLNWANEGGDPEYDYIGSNLKEARKALASCNNQRVTGFEHREQTWSLVKDVDGEWIDIDSITVPAINASTDELLFEVQQHFGGKYTSVFYNEGEENQVCIDLRIADHSGRHANNGILDTVLSVVIANSNPTERFQSQGPEGIGNEIFFDDYYTAEQIIEAINIRLEEMKDELEEAINE